jgi:hypothetical protein
VRRSDEKLQSGGEKLIQKQGPIHILACDICGEEAGDYDDFYDAVDAKKTRGFKSERHGEDWMDICGECQEDD